MHMQRAVQCLTHSTADQHSRCDGQRHTKQPDTWSFIAYLDLSSSCSYSKVWTEQFPVIKCNACFAVLLLRWNCYPSPILHWWKLLSNDRKLNLSVASVPRFGAASNCIFFFFFLLDSQANIETFKDTCQSESSRHLKARQNLAKCSTAQYEIILFIWQNLPQS